MTKRDWQYTGDINLSHGGYYIRHTSGDDFAEVVEVVNYDGSVRDRRFEGVALVRKGSAYLTLRTIREGMKTCGLTARDFIGLSRETKAREFAYAVLAYNGGELDDMAYVGVTSRGYSRSQGTADRTTKNDGTFRRMVEREYLD